MNAPPDISQYDDFLTVPEVAIVLRISKMTVYRMLHKEVIDSIRVGRSFRIPRAEVERVLRQGVPVVSGVSA